MPCPSPGEFLVLLVRPCSSSVYVLPLAVENPVIGAAGAGAGVETAGAGAGALVAFMVFTALTAVSTVGSSPVAAIGVGATVVVGATPPCPSIFKVSSTSAAGVVVAAVVSTNGSVP